MTGILLIQLGTPDAPFTRPVRRYLREFLSDRRIIEVPPAVWWWILNLFILPFRPSSSAAKYRRVWNDETGGPLKHYSILQSNALKGAFGDVPVFYGMQYGNPSVESVVRKMTEAGIDKIIVMPMYPQYSATTTASATDHLFKALIRMRNVPAIRIVPPYYDHPAYIAALETIVREELAKLDWEPEHFIFTFHGIPQKYSKRGDIYATHVVRTTRKLVEKLGLKRSQWTQTYQSRFGPQAWLKPYTDDVLTKLAKKGLKRAFAIMPGFTADCLVTIDEIGHESLENFEESGGEKLHACRCLNDHPAWIEAMAQILADEGHGWLPPRSSAKMPMETTIEVKAEAKPLEARIETVDV